MPRGGSTSGTRHGNGAGCGPGAGPGWGGSAKGPGRGDVVPFKFGNPGGGRTASEKAKLRSIRADEMEDNLYDLALNGELEATRVQASARLHAICDGMPVQRQQISGDPDAPLNIVSMTPEDAARAYQRLANGE